MRFPSPDYFRIRVDFTQTQSHALYYVNSLTLSNSGQTVSGPEAQNANASEPLSVSMIPEAPSLTKTVQRTRLGPLLGFTLLAFVGWSAWGQPVSQAKEQDQDTTVKVYKKVAPATVFITSAHLSEHSIIGGPSSGIGSGVLLDEQGSILTNAHVIEGASQILAVLYDGTKLEAEVVGADPVTDLALLRVALPRGHHAIVQLGDSDLIEIGQKVMAIGHPFGLGYAVTTGVVSGLVLTPETAAMFQERVIQTSAAINPGNSGGPLADAEGRVIAINSAMLAGAQNIGFAIPINTAKKVVSELRLHGRVMRPWLGITGKLLTEDIIYLFALPLVKGVLVADVAEGSPAQRAGLRAGQLNVIVKGEPWILGGDIVVAVNGMEVKTPEQYVAVFKKLKVGETVELNVIRNGHPERLHVTLEERPKQPWGYQPSKAPEKVEFRPLVLPQPMPHPSAEGLAF